jgi:hypothetical protein
VGERRELAPALGALCAQTRVHRALRGSFCIAARPLGGLLHGRDLAAHLDEVLLSGGTGDIGDAGTPDEEEQPNGG